MILLVISLYFEYLEESSYVKKLLTEGLSGFRAAGCALISFKIKKNRRKKKSPEVCSECPHRGLIAFVCIARQRFLF